MNVMPALPLIINMRTSCLLLPIQESPKSTKISMLNKSWNVIHGSYSNQKNILKELSLQMRMEWNLYIAEMEIGYESLISKRLRMTAGSWMKILMEMYG